MTGISLDDGLDRFRKYLMILAMVNWPRKLQGRLDPADLVQQTLKDAFEKRDQFRGSSEAQLAEWLRIILANNLAEVIRREGRQMRTPDLERSLSVALEDSSSRLEVWLAADQSSPSERAMKNEQLNRLADALARMPDLQREAVILHHLQGLKTAEVARQMERSEASVSGLLRRGIKILNQMMRDGE